MSHNTRNNQSRQPPPQQPRNNVLDEEYDQQRQYYSSNGQGHFHAAPAGARFEQPRPNAAYPQLQQQRTIQRSEVVFRQDKQSLSNILGRTCAAIERYIIRVHPEKVINRTATKYDETQRSPQYDDPQVLLGDIDLQLTIASRSIETFLKDHEQNARSALKELDKTIEGWAKNVIHIDERVDLYIAHMWSLLKEQQVSLPPLMQYGPSLPPPQPAALIEHVMRYSEARFVVEEERQRIADDPDFQVGIKLGPDRQPDNRMQDYNNRVNDHEMETDHHLV